MKRDFIQTNGIQVHLVDYGGTGEPLILMHGLTANVHNFDGLVRHGLTAHVRLITFDLRGRGLSDKPETGYAMEDHARDLLGVMDALGLESAVVGGHSFGGLVTMYTAATYPARVKKMVIIDAGLLAPNVRALIKPSLDRMGRTISSWEAHLAAVKASAYFHDGFWDDDLEGYYRADVETLPDGAVWSRCRADAILEAADKGLLEDWEGLLAQAKQPAILIYAPEGVGPGDTPPVMTEAKALATAAMLGDCRAIRASGNHITMLFGRHAAGVVGVIRGFVDGGD